jgi:NADPH:quinone reductase-like Zn-dependent oxidoreductase
VVLAVAGTSFNPSEIGLRSGVLHAIFPLDLPYTLGWDVAGTVVEVGSNTPALAIGDRVIGRLDGGGAAAEYATAPAELLVAAPTTVPLAHAAAIPVAGLTAWQAVVEHARITPGQRVFVNGAGGGVGGFAVQLAKRAGATVIATASPRSAGTVRQHGADQIVDYTTTTPGEAIDGPVDTVLNFVAMSPQQAASLMTLVRPGGLVVSATTPIEPAARTGVTAVHFVVRNDTANLAALVALVEAGELRLDVSASRPLDDLASVHREAESGRTRGKIILVP